MLTSRSLSKSELLEEAVAKESRGHAAVPGGDAPTCKSKGYGEGNEVTDENDDAASVGSAASRRASMSALVKKAQQANAKPSLLRRASVSVQSA